VETLFGVFQKPHAAQARAMPLARVMVAAIDLDHPLYGQIFPAQATFELSHPVQPSGSLSCFH